MCTCAIIFSLLTLKQRDDKKLYIEFLPLGYYCSLGSVFTEIYRHFLLYNMEQMMDNLRTFTVIYIFAIINSDLRGVTVTIAAIQHALSLK